MPHTCFVPQCKTRCSKNYTGGRSLFKPPAHLLEVWASKIARKDRKLTSKDKICEVHFESHFIEREFKHNVNGQEVVIKRCRPTLTKDAIPTLFPSYPRKLTTNSQPKPTETMDVPPQASTSDKSTNTSTSCPEENHQEITTTPTTTTTNNNNHKTLWDLITTFTLPNAWGRFVDEDLDTASLFYFDRNHANTNCASCLCAQWKRDEFIPKIYVRGRQLSRNFYKYFTPTEAGVLHFLSRLEGLQLCRGLDLNSYPYGFSQIKVLTIGDRSYSRNCIGVHADVCARCKYTQMLAAKRDERTRCKLESVSGSATRTIQRYVVRELQLKRRIQACLQDNATRKEMVLENMIGTLPQKQRQVVRHCFKRSERKGFKYTRTWLMESLMMYIKSPCLYNYMRKNEILVLPAVRTLQNFLQTDDDVQVDTDVHLQLDMVDEGPLMEEPQQLENVFEMIPHPFPI